jgi:catechol 2,3-dioxygenase-like lactoylglutathione lyase family enzyme
VAEHRVRGDADVIPARISLVTIGARDMARLRAFYQGLGWGEHPGADDNWAAYKTGGAILCLFPASALAEDARVSGDPPSGFRGVTLAANVEERELVDEAIEAARKAGATITKEPEDAFWGGRSAYFADPEGNLWEVAWMPGSSFDPGGALQMPAG